MGEFAPSSKPLTSIRFFGLQFDMMLFCYTALYEGNCYEGSKNCNGHWDRCFWANSNSKGHDQYEGDLCT